MTSPPKTLILLALLTALLCLSAQAAPKQAQPKPAPQQDQPPQPEQPAQALSDNPRRTPVVRVVQGAGPAVVSIISARPAAQTPFSGNEQLQRFLGLPGSPQPKQKATTQSLGSGVIIDGRQGYVLTNAHVISGAAQITVRLHDGREFLATLVGADPDIDLAVLRLELPKVSQALPQARMGDSTELMIGEPVVAIGNPFGLSHTVTTGVVSAVNRSVRTDHAFIVGLIQTDAAINPGNSGGPLLNILGQVVGINAAVFAKGEGLGFAIPINKAKRVLDELIATGRVAHIWLGLLGENMDQDQAAFFGLNRLGGMVVTDVFPSTPAEAAGIKPGDALLAIGEQRVLDKSQFLGLLLDYAKGDTITVKLRRGREPFEVRLSPQVLDRQASLGLLQWRWGFAPGRNAEGGVLVGEVGANGPAARMGFKPGDVVLQVGNRRTANEADLLGAFYRYQMHTTLILSVQRSGQIYNVRMKI